MHTLTVAEALREVCLRYNEAVDRGVREIHVIHGCNGGQAIRRSLHQFLSSHSRCLQYHLQPGNGGCTILLARRRLPDAATASPLEQRILEICATPRTQEKIVGQLVRRHPEREIKATLERMAAQGTLQVVYRNGHKHFQAPA